MLHVTFGGIKILFPDCFGILAPLLFLIFGILMEATVSGFGRTLFQNQPRCIVKSWIVVIVLWATEQNSIKSVSVLHLHRYIANGCIVFSDLSSLCRYLLDSCASVLLRVPKSWFTNIYSYVQCFLNSLFPFVDSSRIIFSQSNILIQSVTYMYV